MPFTLQVFCFWPPSYAPTALHFSVVVFLLSFQVSCAHSLSETAIDPPRLKVWDSRPEHDSVSRQNPCPAQKQKRRQTFCALPQLGVNNPKPTDKTIVAQPDLRCKSASLTQTKSLGLRLAKAVHPAMLCDPHHHKRIGHAHQTMSHVFFVGRICSYGM